MSLAKYIKDNWAKIAMTWIDGDLEQFPDSFLEEAGSDIPTEVPWSCLSLASFMLKLYGYECKRNFTGITDVNSFVTNFGRGYVYHFSIFCHEFVVIYDEADVCFVDYHFETEREEKMRVERMPRNCVLEYLQSYLAKDFNAHAKFHQGSDRYQHDYEAHYNQYGYITGLCYSKHEITFTPSCADVVETVLNSADGYEEDMKGNELYIQARSRVLASFC